jgi:cell wall-associated NlpC family hydrolase
MLAALCLAGCAGQSAVETKPAAVSVPAGPAASVGERAAAIALRQVGSAYRYGGASPGGFDCSGLVQYSYRAAGKSVPRTTGQLWNAAGPVPHAELQVGDLLFFRFDGKMSHVGIYVGGRRFVHAPSTGKTVSVDSLATDFYGAALVRAGRLP